ncbi:hypothetical protein BCR42DRAFT_386337 [Absidia repens]|uniref:Uncharacterized protein n=1 Tax=Absidia repens TaxID=90262 RepID=A0A1X2J1N6_9FUNG|nr:hypothetical protein BCR42DRAFT_386337 [Absidia repens]
MDPNLAEFRLNVIKHSRYQFKPISANHQDQPKNVLVTTLCTFNPIDFHAKASLAPKKKFCYDGTKQETNLPTSHLEKSTKDIGRTRPLPIVMDPNLAEFRLNVIKHSRYQFKPISANRQDQPKSVLVTTLCTFNPIDFHAKASLAPKKKFCYDGHKTTL